MEVRIIGTPIGATIAIRSQDLKGILVLSIIQASEMLKNNVTDVLPEANINVLKIT